MEGPKNSLAAKRTRLVVERLDELEPKVESLIEDRGRLVQSIQAAFDKLNTQILKAAEVLEAAITALGPEFAPKLEAAAKENKDKSLARQAELQKKELTDLVAENRIKLVPVVSEASLLVGREFDKDGNVKHPGHVQIHFNELAPTLKDSLKGKSVGDTVSTQAETTFEITAIYEGVVAQAEEPKSVDSVGDSIDAQLAQEETETKSEA